MTTAVRVRVGIYLADQQITVGRANDAGLVLNDDYAAKHHARIFRRMGSGSLYPCCGSQRRFGTIASVWGSVAGVPSSLMGTAREPPSRKTTSSFKQVRSSG